MLVTELSSLAGTYRKGYFPEARGSIQPLSHR